MKSKEEIEISWYDSDADFEAGIQTTVKEATRHVRGLLEALDARCLYPKRTRLEEIK